MSKKLLFNLNKNVSQNYTYVKYTGTIVTAINTLEKPIKNAILKGDTKYRDIDTGEILDSFDRTKNLELVSVKMPVLQTMGKNLFDGIVKENDYVTIVEYDGKRCVSITARNDLDGLFEFTTPIPCMKGLTLSYMIQSGNYCMIRPVFEDGTFGNQIGSWMGFPEWTRTSYEIPQNSKRLRGFVTSSSGNTMTAYLELTTIQIEEGSNATSHESYKTNILHTPEEIVLKGIGDVKDELNCLTGQVTECIGEYQITGEEEWVFVQGAKRLEIQNPKFMPNAISGGFACDKLEPKQGNNLSLYSTMGTYYIGYTSNNYIRIILGNDIAFLSQGIEWLKTNKPTIQYTLATPTIKTVDLSIVDQDSNVLEKMNSFNDTTHVITSSDTIPPIFEGYIATKESVE